MGSVLRIGYPNRKLSVVGGVQSHSTTKPRDRCTGTVELCGEALYIEVLDKGHVHA